MCSCSSQPTQSPASAGESPRGSVGLTMCSRVHRVQAGRCWAFWLCLWPTCHQGAEQDSARGESSLLPVRILQTSAALIIKEMVNTDIRKLLCVPKKICMQGGICDTIFPMLELCRYRLYLLGVC